MPFKEPVHAVDVYLEQRSTRKYVGRLTRVNDEFCFDYADKYLRSIEVIPLGPEMPLTKKTHCSKELFRPFVERVPSRQNPAFADYCRMMGISPKEKDPFILLTTIGRKGPSSFIFEPVFVHKFTGADLKKFRNKLAMTTREFAACFQFAPASITRIERGQSSGKEVLKRAAIYQEYPQVALDQLHRHGGVLHTKKKQRILDILRESS